MSQRIAAATNAPIASAATIPASTRWAVLRLLRAFGQLIAPDDRLLEQALGAVELQGEEAEADQDHQEAGPRHSGTRQDDPDEYHEEAEDDDGRAVDDVALLVARLALLELVQQLGSVRRRRRHVGSP